MKTFKPTYLYVKQHNVTGLKYFGKTVKSDPVKYKGSGKHWTRHINKYGNNVTTVWYQLFEDKQELTEYAIKFSKENNIVKSDEWANLKDEDGLWGGGVKGAKIKPHTEEHKRKISESIRKLNLEKPRSRKPPTQKVKKGRSKGGWKWSEEDKINHSLRQTGIPKRRMCCIHCKSESGIANILQWHGDKCKMNPVKNDK